MTNRLSVAHLSTFFSFPPNANDEKSKVFKLIMRSGHVDHWNNLRNRFFRHFLRLKITDFPRLNVDHLFRRLVFMFIYLFFLPFFALLLEREPLSPRPITGVISVTSGRTYCWARRISDYEKNLGRLFEYFLSSFNKLHVIASFMYLTHAKLQQSNQD